MKRTKLLIILILNVIGTIGFIAVNIFSVLYPINNKTQKEISDMFFSLITPAPFTFSIWGIIYLLLILFIIYQVVLFIKKESYPIEKTGIWYFITCILNISWIIAWSYIQIEISLALIILFFVSLIVIYNRLGIGKQSSSTLDKIFLNLPFSVYTAWLAIATTLNITILLIKLNLRPFLGIPDDIWGFIVIILLSSITAYTVIRRNDIFFGMTAIWALLGILSTRLNNIYLAPLTLSATVGGIVILTILEFYKIIKKEVYS
ncbi:MAG: hypothetical protein ACP5QP_02685 [Brevinematia bacterium]